ncbi:PH domain-containing protein [Actinokineospora sp.]|uniref:PH domain-containing protein n=1 Tax=Actinokineospora sp. TaxID=1872133 RepID=UPI004037F228
MTEATRTRATPAPTPRLRPPHNQVEPRAVGWWATQSALAFGGLAIPLLIVGLTLPPTRPWVFIGAALAVVVGLVDALVVSRIRYRVHRWEVTDDAVYVRRGWFWQEWRVAPMSRIQTVDTIRGPLEQAFRLATVTVTTASAKGALKIQGLDHEQAEELVERLTEATQATPGDAT